MLQYVSVCFIFMLFFCCVEVSQRRPKLSRLRQRKAKHYRGPLRGVTLRLLNFDYKKVKSDTRQKLAEIEQPSLHRLV